MVFCAENEIIHIFVFFLKTLGGFGFFGDEVVFVFTEKRFQLQQFGQMPARA